MFFPKSSIFVVAPICSLLLPLLVEGMPKETGSPYRTLMGIRKRQDTDPYDGPAPEVENGDPEPYSDTDYLRDAIPYRSNYFKDNAPLTSMKVGANTSDATMTVFTTVLPGTKPPAPVDTNQGSQFEVDHLLEMQNIHGAFTVLAKPSNIPQSDWDAVKKAVFSKPPSAGYPPMQSIASKISGSPNMEAIPAAINNFKGQVFRGVINNGKNAPSNSRYPTEFGPAVNKLLADRKSSYDEVITDLADAMKAAANNNTDVSSFFASYAGSVYTSATSFLSQWKGKSGVYATATSTSTSTPSSAIITTTAKAATPTSSAACNCNENGCTPESPVCCANGTCG